MLAQGFSLNHFNRLNFLIWCSLAFQAGAINAGGFLACHRFVSHITGFATMFGNELAIANWRTAVGLLSVPMFFVLGGIFSALLIDRRISQKRRPQYTQVIFLVGLLLLSVAVLGTTNNFSNFGATLDLDQDYEFLAILCLACGMQNAAVTSASGAVIRTTHLTGITTDLSIGLVRVFSKNLPTEVHSQEVLKNQIRIGLILSFMAGSVVGSLFFLTYEYLGFLLPAAMSLILTLLAIRYRRRPDLDGARIG